MAGKKFLHIMPDDKFLDYFIEQSEQVAPGISEYWIKTENIEGPLHVKSKKVKYFNWNSEPVDKLAAEANKYGKLFLHSFSLDMLDFIYKIDSSIHITWFFWGFEGYKYTFHYRRWFLPETWKVKQKLLTKDVNPLFGLYKKLERKNLHITNYLITTKILKRINRCATWVRYDYEMINHVNCRMTWSDYSYFTNKQLNLDTVKVKENNYKKIWIGNSCDLTNNHADALIELKKHNWSGEVYMPLSYSGSEEYKSYIINLGKDIFGHNFYPITEFMPLQEYQQLLNECGIVWMNHIRQQAAGNVLAALYMGKAVMLNQRSNLYKTLLSWGITVYISDKGFDNMRISGKLIEKNKHLIIQNTSYEHALNCIRSLYA